MSSHRYCAHQQFKNKLVKFCLFIFFFNLSYVIFSPFFTRWSDPSSQSVSFLLVPPCLFGFLLTPIHLNPFFLWWRVWKRRVRHTGATPSACGSKGLQSVLGAHVDPHARPRTQRGATRSEGSWDSCYGKTGRPPESPLLPWQQQSRFVCAFSVSGWNFSL